LVGLEKLLKELSGSEELGVEISIYILGK